MYTEHSFWEGDWLELSSGGIIGGTNRVSAQAAASEVLDLTSQSMYRSKLQGMRTCLPLDLLSESVDRSSYVIEKQKAHELLTIFDLI
jgi:hypothetical protein